MTAIEIPQVYRKRASSFSQAPEGRQVGHVWGISSESKRVPSFFLLMFSIGTWSRCRPSGAKECGESMFLYTCRPAGALACRQSHIHLANEPFSGLLAKWIGHEIAAHCAPLERGN